MDPRARLRGAALAAVPQGGILREDTGRGVEPMALRTNHYDVAFEALLRQRKTPYVAVDEGRRTVLRNATLKSMDFIVYSTQSHNLLVDVKGRRFPSGPDGAGHLWENWATREDLEALAEWRETFGPGFRGLLVFAYHVVEPRWESRHLRCFRFRRKAYAFYGVWADEYEAAMCRRSPRWDTVSLPVAEFRRLRAPVESYL
jgi:hypothetical protein